MQKKRRRGACEYQRDGDIVTHTRRYFSSSCMLSTKHQLIGAQPGISLLCVSLVRMCVTPPISIYEVAVCSALITCACFISHLKVCAKRRSNDFSSWGLFYTPKNNPKGTNTHLKKDQIITKLNTVSHS